MCIDILGFKICAFERSFQIECGDFFMLSFLTGLRKRCHFFVYTIDRCVRVNGIQQRSRSMRSDKSNQAGFSDYTRCLLTISALLRDKFRGDLINKHAFRLRHYRCTKHTCIQVPLYSTHMHSTAAVFNTCIKRPLN